MLLVWKCVLMQLLQELSQVPCMADINFAKKASIMKRNRYKDRFPCECNIFTLPSVLQNQLNLLLQAIYSVCNCNVELLLYNNNNTIL